jgi:choline dehydrogenase-like flavoprotein
MFSRLFPDFQDTVTFEPHPHSSPPGLTRTEYDAVVVGSGFGGCMAALELVEAGLRVLMLERGGWVARGPENWSGEGAFVRTPFYAEDSAFEVVGGKAAGGERLCTCVGGPSVFYGGASFRFRERDFQAAPEITAGSGAAWPVDYAALEPLYTRAEGVLGVAGETGFDPTEPPRSAPYPQPPAVLSDAAATALSLAFGLAFLLNLL